MGLIAPCHETLGQWLPMESSRLSIRYLSKDDMNDIYEFRSDAETCQYIAPPMDWNGLSKHFQERGQWTGKDGAWVALAIVLKSEQKVIGEGALRIESAFASRAEIGYMFHRHYHGKGYGTEAAKLLRDFSFEKLAANKVVAYCDALNTASSQLLLKLGLDQEGLFKEHMPRGDQWSDTLAFGLTRKRWQELK